MGFLSGGDDQSQSEKLEQQQIDMNKQELAEKKQSLYQTRLDIIKGQGAEQWTPNRASGVPATHTANVKLPFGGRANIPY